MNYLFINTVNPNHVSFAIFTSGGVVLYSLGFVEKQEDLNEKLNAFLKNKKIKPETIKGIMVISGPGSFSASRAGVVLANAFNFLYKIPVLSVKDEPASMEDLIKINFGRLKRAKAGTAAEVYYEKPPNITMKK